MKTIFQPLVWLAALWCCNTAYTQTITSFMPASGSIGSLVTITGTGLSSPTAFTIGGVPAIAISNDGTTLVAMLMPTAATGAISITTTGSPATSSTNFEVLPTKVPNTQQGNKLVGTGAVGNANQAVAVAVSADGSTAVVGGFLDNTDIGAVWVYTRSAGVWTEQGTKLVGTGAVGTSRQGRSVAVSADGNTLVSGGYTDNSGQGALWVFTRTGSTWTQQGGKIVCTDNVSLPYLGETLAVSADGNTIVSGSFRDANFVGATWVFQRTAGTWAQQGSKLLGTGVTVRSGQGKSVAISADGNTFITGGNEDNSSIGAAWVFTRSGATWTQQGSKLVGTGNTGAGSQGTAVALSADGNTAAIGAPYDNNNKGALWVFMRSSGTWTQQGTKIVGTGGVGLPYINSALTISADGNVIAAGGPNDNNTAVGATWLFKRTGSTWAQHGTKITGTGGIGAGSQGIGVAISADANTLLVGGYGDNAFKGAVWAFIPVCGNATIYVDANIATSGDGTSFATAYKTLDEALTFAWNCSAVTRINVANGTYKPTLKPYNTNGTNMVTSDVRDATFHIRAGLALYGSYDAATGLRSLPYTSSGGVSPSTVLSADYNDNDTYTGEGANLAITGNSENAYHVLLASFVDNTPEITINGFEILSGSALGGNFLSIAGNIVYQNRGAGASIINGKATFRNNLFVRGSAGYGGGGVFVEGSIASFTHNSFTNNYAVEGGGLVISNGSDSLVQNTFTGNRGVSYGGGTRISGANTVLTGSTFVRNGSGDGGGISTNNTPIIITDNTFEENAATGYGGGFDINFNSIVFNHNISINNTANIGGGGDFYDITAATFNNNIFSGNNATNSGGGLFTQSTSLTSQHNVFDNNTAAGQGGGIYMNGANNTLLNNTFYNNRATNEGGAMFVHNSTNNATNNIFWNNKKGSSTTLQSADVYFAGTNTNTFTNNMMQLAGSNYATTGSGNYDIGTTPSGNVFATNPRFTNASIPNGNDGIGYTTDDGLRIQCESPAIDAGTNTGATALDISGDPIYNTTKDIGAYERQTPSDCGIYTSSVTCNNFNIGTTPMNTWVDLRDEDGNIIAAFNALGNNMYNINVNITNEGSALIDGGMPRLGRAVEVRTDAFPPTENYRMRLYYKNAELAAYNTDNGTSLTKTNLDILHKSNGSGCLFSGYSDASFGRIANTNLVKTDYLDGFYLEFALDHFTVFGAGATATPLPVRLLSFNGNAKDNTNVLRWVTASEINTSHFEIETSATSNNFKTIGSVTAHNTQNGGSYIFTDKEPAAFAYYRLKMIDKDASFEYSNVINLRHKVSGFAAQQIYPNPTANSINISFTAENPTLVSFMLYDMLGKQISTVVKSSQIGFNLQNISMDDLANGIYYLTITNGSGEVETHKIVKM